MSGKNKLKKFADLSTFPNVFQNHDVLLRKNASCKGEND